MKNTNKILLAAAITLQLSGTLCADAWADAFALFGGPQAVFANRGSMSWTKTSDQVKKSGNATPQALAVALYETQNRNANAGKFAGAASQDDLQIALNAALQTANQVAAEQQAPAAGPIMSAPQAPAQPSNVNAGYASNWFGSSSASSDAAAKAAQKADILAISSSSKDLQKIAESGLEGLNMYLAYIDVTFQALQEAINAVLDPKDAQKLLQYIQKSAANLSVSAANSNANVLGQMSSSSKKHNNKQNKSAKNKNKK
ncbi:MAG: hypothetical protein ACXWL2_00770 [Candidatus Chromulinivorax sp.]